MNVTVFNNFTQVIEQTTLSAILNHIKDGTYRADIEKLRHVLATEGEKKYKEEKKHLPGFTVSSTHEGGRTLQTMTAYTGNIILDIDKLSSVQLNKAFNDIIQLPYTLACFRSPSNNGLKFIVRSDASQYFHLLAFNEIKAYYEKNICLPIDPSGKDINRLCFVSWDEEIYINNNSETFKINITMKKNEVEKLVKQIELNRIDITDGYENWLNIGFALSDEFGEDGREYFHKISQFSTDYNTEIANEQYNKCLKSKGQGITISTLFYKAKEKGIVVSSSAYNYHNDSQSNTKAETASKKIKDRKNSNLFNIVESYLSERYDFRYNIVTSKLEYKIKNQKNYLPITDYDENSILREIRKADILVNFVNLRCILYSDFCPTFDPFVHYFKELPQWDGETDYIKSLADTVNTTNNELWNECFKKWIVAVVASLLVPKVVNHTAIIFSGAQGTGKTTWMENLCPKHLNSYMFSGTINPNNKDTLIFLSECMLINMDELENMNRTEIGTLKEIITKSTINIRKPYGRNSEKVIRRASFMGSVNTAQFLNDTTGSRRFLCFEVNSIDYNHNIDINMVYSQAYALWKDGFRFYFNKEEIESISTNNEQYQIRTAVEEYLLTLYKPVELSEAFIFQTASQIAAHIAEFSHIQVNDGVVISVGKALKKHGFHRTKRNGIYSWAIHEI